MNGNNNLAFSKTSGDVQFQRISGSLLKLNIKILYNSESSGLDFNRY